MAPTILILTPILMPIVKQAGTNPVYFGVLFIINNRRSASSSMWSAAYRALIWRILSRGVWPFMIAQLIVLFLMIMFPALVTVPAKWFGG